MFDLKRAVETWSHTVRAGRCEGTESVDELTDHLYCEIDRARAEGLSDEQAFAAAVARIGAPKALVAEQAKNRTLRQTVCALEARDANLPGSGRSLLVAHAILWAAVILAASILLSKSSASTAFAFLLTGVLVPAWWASELLLRRGLRRAGGPS
ncbi:MAG: hypothetical protein JNK60_13295 [Acidobacteria bacterium]|nr:hypothetical protein [Acidobacteriota bacterium]